MEQPITYPPALPPWIPSSPDATDIWEQLRMRHPVLTIRMAIVGAFILGLYGLLALGLYTADFHPAVIGVGIVGVIAGQYVLGVRTTLRGLDVEPLPKDEYPEIHRRTEHLSDRMGITRPRLFVGDLGGPNAFAVGRRGAGIVVLSESLLDLLDLDEVEGVIAHELAHLKNRDSVVMGIGYTIASIIGWGLFAIVWIGMRISNRPSHVAFVGNLVSRVVHFLISVLVLALSRYREYIADTDAVVATGSPDGLASALDRIDRFSRHHGNKSTTTSRSAFCIYGSSHRFLDRFLATHPPIEKRIDRLRAVEPSVVSAH